MLLIVDLVCTIGFSFIGFTVSISKPLPIALLMSFLTAFGGGLLRCLLLVQTPPIFQSIWFSLFYTFAFFIGVLIALAITSQPPS